MSSKTHLRDYDCGKAVGRLEAYQSLTTVSVAMGVKKTVIPRLKKAAKGENALRKHAGGRSRNITLLENPYAALVAKRNKISSSGQIAGNLATTTGTHALERTITQR
ncbi:hypothetical protein TNCV_4503641 [Trichonephila clavipes]|nr:hypothetical protein TNCV_4503641 [Trichonephila clavipes]